MSTRATIVGGDDFHLYREQADGSVRLRIDIKEKPLNIVSPIIYMSGEYVDIEIPRHVLKAILDKKDRFVEGWEHLHDDPILGILASIHEEKEKTKGIRIKCLNCGYPMSDIYLKSGCPWCGDDPIAEDDWNKNSWRG